MSIEGAMINWDFLEDKAFELSLSSAGYHVELDMDIIDPEVAKILITKHKTGKGSYRSKPGHKRPRRGKS